MSKPSQSGADTATVDSSCPKNNRSSPNSNSVEEAALRLAEVPSTNVLFVGHGSRRGFSNAEFESLVAAYAERCSTRLVRFGYIELAQPILGLAIDDLAVDLQAGSEIVLAPLFLFRAGHCKNDLPIAADLARVRHPQVRFSISEPLGVDMRLVELAWRRAIQHGGLGEETLIVLVGRGSSDAGANAEFFRFARLLFEGRCVAGVEPCFIGITEPNVPDTLARLARLRPKALVIVPYLLFAGRLVERLENWVGQFKAEYPWIKVKLAGHLEGDEAVLDVIQDRIAEAIAGEKMLDCDACAYRVPMPGRFHEVGGLRALLWSLRHGFTHAQAMPAEHAHAALEKHVLVCGNADCAERGGLGLLSELRRRVKASGRSKTIRVTRTSCMGRCGEGPTLVVYPDGIWYREVQQLDALELVNEHLLGGRLVARLVDNIMQ